MNDDVEWKRQDAGGEVDDLKYSRLRREEMF